MWSRAEWSKLERVAKSLHAETDWLARVIWLESGGDHAAVNPTSGATGLIQWMPVYYRQWGTREELIARGRTGQLELARAWLASFGVRPRDAVDLYLLVFLPAAAKDGREIVADATTSIARSNPVLCDADGRITRASIAAKLATIVVPISWHHVQTELKRLGYYDGAVDGIPGPKTAMAVHKVLTS